MAALSCAILLAWLALVLLRGGFRRVRLPAPCPEPARWPAVVAVLAQRFPGMAFSSSALSSIHYVLLTDADIAHAPSSLRQLVARAEAEQRVLTSLMVRLRCDSQAERALVPAFVFFFAMLYPFDWVKQPGSRSAAAAGGCMLARLDALAAIGGLAAAMKRRAPIRLDLARARWRARPG